MKVNNTNKEDGNIKKNNSIAKIGQQYNRKWKQKQVPGFVNLTTYSNYSDLVIFQMVIKAFTIKIFYITCAKIIFILTKNVSKNKLELNQEEICLHM